MELLFLGGSIVAALLLVYSKWPVQVSALLSALLTMFKKPPSPPSPPPAAPSA